MNKYINVFQGERGRQVISQASVCSTSCTLGGTSLVIPPAMLARELAHGCTEDGCQKAFKHPQGLREHLKKVHKIVLTFKDIPASDCKICGKKFKRVDDHMKKVIII